VHGVVRVRKTTAAPFIKRLKESNMNSTEQNAQIIQALKKAFNMELEAGRV